ncbi:hypothetical protein AUTU_06510 [Aureibacter tunicatorum]|nr:hypothetical protein AUTU_06510 [Aureibacter tunicatorum]
MREFIVLAKKIYKGYPNWIRPLDKDIEQVFDKNKNKAYRHGESVQWLLKDDSGTAIGRIAAFYNKKTANRDNKQPTGGLGFFECIDDQNAANILFDTAKEWLAGKGMEAMDGPVNFGERDRWWGLLIDGFDREPNYLCNYHPEYYLKLFENYGFKLYFKQFTFERPVQLEITEKMRAKAERVAKYSDIRFEHCVHLNKMGEYTELFKDAYNKAWGPIKGVSELSSGQAKAIMKSIKPILDRRLLWFGFKGGEVISFFIMLPEMNQIFKHLDGQFGLLAKLKLLYYKTFVKNPKLTGLIFGVIPEYQGKGVEAAMVAAAAKIVQHELSYETLEMNWIGDWNPKMLRVCELVDGTVVKTHGTYRYLFDRTAPFERYPIMGEKKDKNNN